MENVREKYSLKRLIKVPKSSRDMKRLRSGRDIHDTCVRENGTSIFLDPAPVVIRSYATKIFATDVIVI